MTQDPNPDSEERAATGRPGWRRFGGVIVVVSAGVVVALSVIPLSRGPQSLDTELRAAIGACDAVAIREAVARGADPNHAAPAQPEPSDPFAPPQGSHPMEAYSGCPTPDVLQALQDAGVDLSTYLQGLAERAMSPARPEVMAWLLDNGLSPQTRWANAEGWETLCHRVARRGQGGVLRVVLAAGADPNALDSLGMTPLARVRQQISLLRAGFAGSPPLQSSGSVTNDPAQRYAEVIAMLQEAGGTE